MILIKKLPVNLLTQLLILLLCFKSSAAVVQVVTEEWPPYNFSNKQGQIVGSSTEKVKQVLALAGVEYQLSIFPWARAYNMALNQKNVLIYTIVKTPERENLFHWLCPLTQPLIYRFFSLKHRNDIKINSIEDAKAYTTGVIKGDYSHQFLNSLGFQDKVHLDVSYDSTASVRKLFKKRIDLILSTDISIEGRAKAQGEDFNKLAAKFTIASEQYNESCIAFSKETDPKIISAVTAAFNQLNAKEAVE